MSSHRGMPILIPVTIKRYDRKMKGIVIGSGGREHAIAWALACSSTIDEVICIPGNGGTISEPKCRNLPAHLADIAAVADLCKKELKGSTQGFVVIGPEDPLAAGLADALAARGIHSVGPCKKAAALEASKDLAKHFMARHGVLRAESRTFTNVHEAVSWIHQCGAPIVVKADGLAAGKGVVVAYDTDTAIGAVRDFMTNNILGAAGATVVIEEFLEGEEVSILAAVSVSPDMDRSSCCILPFVPARDHKRLLDGAEGPNTGGMGAVAPVAGISPEVMEEFRCGILEPTLQGLVAEGWEYRGFIFFGLMITSSGPRLLEYNVRLGDPETQAVLPLMNFDFADLCRAITEGTLHEFELSWKQGVVCAPVAVSRGYPGTYEKGLPVYVDRTAVATAGARLFFAGASVDHRAGATAGHLVTSGGRVLAVSAHGADLDQAREQAYRALEAVDFDGLFYRRDIGVPGAAMSNRK